jgi:hypothetical protein
VFTLELRARNSRHWLLYPTEIIPPGQEVWAGVQAAIRAIELRAPGEEYNMPDVMPTTTISPAQQWEQINKYSRKNGRSPIDW